MAPPAAPSMPLAGSCHAATLCATSSVTGRGRTAQPAAHSTAMPRRAHASRNVRTEPSGRHRGATACGEAFATSCTLARHRRTSRLTQPSAPARCSSALSPIHRLRPARSDPRVPESCCSGRTRSAALGRAGRHIRSGSIPALSCSFRRTPPRCTSDASGPREDVPHR